MNGVSQQSRCPQKPPPGASCSCTSCCPLGTGHMAQPGTDQHKGGIAFWETTCHTGAAAVLPVQPFHDVVGANTSPVFAGKIAVGPCSFFYAI